MKDTRFLGLFPRNRRNNAAKPPENPPKTLARAASASPTSILSLTKEAHFLLSDYLSFADWGAMNSSCRTLRAIYQREDLWRRRAARMLLFPEFVFDHPDFRCFQFDFRQVVRVLLSGGDAIKKALKFSVEPWQLAALMGMSKELAQVYPGDTILDLADENGYGVEDYYVMAGEQALLEEWGKRFSPNFRASDDTQDKFSTLAVNVGRLPMLLFLIQRYGYNIKKLNEQTRHTLLHAAVQFDQIDMMSYLIQNGVSYEEGSDLLLFASYHGRWKIYDDLYSRGMRVCQLDSNEVLRNAAKHGNRTLFQATMREFNTDLSTYPLQYRIAFFIDIMRGGNLALVKEAFNEGIISIEELIREGKNIFHFAAEFGHTQLILDFEEDENFSKHFDPRAPDEAGNTLIHYSARQGDFNQTLFLCRRFFDEAELLRPNLKNETIVHIAANRKHLNFLHLVGKCFRRSKPLETLDSMKNSALHHAGSGCAVTVILWLVEAVKLSLYAQNAEGDTPLHILARRAISYKEVWPGFMRIAKLVDFSLITDCKNNDTKTIRDYMLEGNQGKNVEELAQSKTAMVFTPPTFN